MGREVARSPDTRDWSDWVGRSVTRSEVVSVERVAALAATLDLDHVPREGAPLPPGWHWLFFNSFARRRDLGVDGHPRRGRFLPPVDLPRRMWAGGNVTWLAPIIVGKPARRLSEVVSVRRKSGESGPMVFVTVRHTVACESVECLVEEQQLVYLDGARSARPGTRRDAEPGTLVGRAVVTPDAAMLFRYSALTANSHRIHYDQRYARDQEGYPDLVVQGPLTATLMLGLATECRPDHAITRFDFRGTRPLFVDGELTLEAYRGADERELSLLAFGAERELAMRAVVRTES